MWTVSFNKFCPYKIRRILGGNDIKTMLKKCADAGVPVRYVNTYTYKDGLKTCIPTFDVGVPVVASIYSED